MGVQKQVNVHGTFQRCKTYLVAKGFHQTPGLNYTNTFNSMIKPTTIHIILAHALRSRWSSQQVDINYILLDGDLKEIVYMYQPLSFSSSNSKQVCKLNKTIYGLKQASWSWFHKLSKTLINMDFSLT